MTPLAFEMLLMSSLGRNAGIEIPGYTHSNPREWAEVVEYAAAEGLWSDTGITARCRAWLEMIHAVPLPVQQWADPRDGVVNIGEYTRHQEDYTRAAPPPRAESVTVITPEAKAAAYIATLPNIPDDFILNPGLISRLPEGLRAGDDVELIYRDGKIGKPARVGTRADVQPAASVNWQHRGGDDDVIGYKPLAMPEIIKQHVGNSPASKAAAQ